MKRIILLIMVICITASLCACGNSNASADKTDAKQNAEPQYEITYSSAKIWENSIGSHNRLVVVEVENKGNNSLLLSMSGFDLEDSNGNLLESEQYVVVAPPVIAPGEKGYMFDNWGSEADFEGEAVVKPHLNITNTTSEPTKFNISDIELKENKFGVFRVIGRIENDSDEEYTRVNILCIVKNENNEPIAVISSGVDNVKPHEKYGFDSSCMTVPKDITFEDGKSVEVFAYVNQY